MNLKVIFSLLFLFTTVTLAGCYTKLGYYDTAYLKDQQYKSLEKTEDEGEHVSDSDAGTDVDEYEGYYGRRKPAYRYVRDSYWVPYTPYPYLVYYPPVYYYPLHSSYYGYPTPYYRHYGILYPYWGYYGRYRGSPYLSATRGTYKSRVLRKERAENRRSRASRSVTSPKSQSERPRRGLKKDDKN